VARAQNRRGEGKCLDAEATSTSIVSWLSKINLIMPSHGVDTKREFKTAKRCSSGLGNGDTAENIYLLGDFIAVQC